MKRIWIAAALALVVLTGCTKPATRPAQIALPQGVTLELELPRDWTIRDTGGEEAPLPPGEFDTIFYIYDRKDLIGYLGASEFEPYPNEQEIPADDYYKTVWPGLRLSSFFVWDPFEPVAQSETGASGVVKITYKDPVQLADMQDKSTVEIPVLQTVGVLAYDKSARTYVGMAFLPDAGGQEQVRSLAVSLHFSHDETPPN